MSSHRLEKVARELVREVSEVIRLEMRDPGLGLVTVIRVKVSRDFDHALVYVSILGSRKQQKKSLAALERARGFIQYHVGRRMRSMRRVPELSFRFDESIEGAIRISRLIDHAVSTHGAGEPCEPAAAPPRDEEPTGEDFTGEEE
jgi:ribosome-binding factor A